MTKKIYLEVLKKCAGLLHFPLLSDELYFFAFKFLLKTPFSFLFMFKSFSQKTIRYWKIIAPTIQQLFTLHFEENEFKFNICYFKFLH